MNSYIFRNYIYENDQGRLCRIGGGQYRGEFRVNLDQNRIEIKSNDSISELVIEYVARGRATNPQVHIYAEEALRAYIYYKIIERKSFCPCKRKGQG